MKILLLILAFSFLFCKSNQSSNTPVQDSNKTVSNSKNPDDTLEVIKEWDMYYRGNGFDGCFVLYDLKNNKYKVFNPGRAEMRFTPASTFKIPNSLIALQEKVIADENEVIKWDGVKRQIENWNQDQTLKSAFKNSTVWFYQELARRVGTKEKYEEWLEKIKYGNMKTGSKVDDFWLQGDIAISPYEQIDFLKRFQSNNLPFDQSVLDKVKDIMLFEEGDGYKIYAKTGWSIRVQPSVGWFVGFVETKDNVYFFVNNMVLDNDENLKFRIEIVKDILKSEGIIN
jgi:beta-lactamase class D